MIDSHQQWRAAQRANLCDEIRDLLGRLVVARKQDDTADGGLAQQVAVRWRQRDPFYIEHDRSERHRIFLDKNLNYLFYLVFIKYRNRFYVRRVRKHINNTRSRAVVAFFVHQGAGIPRQHVQELGRESASILRA